MPKANRYQIPLNTFDMLAGAKAVYESLGESWHINPQPWETMTAQHQDLWVKALKAGICEAQEVRQRKVTGRLLCLLSAQRTTAFGRMVLARRQARRDPQKDQGGTEQWPGK